MPSGLSWFDDVRGKLVTVVFGPYFPDEAKSRLVRLRDSLRGVGYAKSYLVEDLDIPAQESGEDENSYLLRKSRYWVEHCDVGFMVYVANCDNSGVTTELNHLCARAKGRMWQHAIFLDKRQAPSRLVRGILHDWEGELDRADYITQEQLNELARGKLPDYLFKLYYDLRDRPS